MHMRVWGALSNLTRSVLEVRRKAVAEAPQRETALVVLLVLLVIAQLGCCWCAMHSLRCQLGAKPLSSPRAGRLRRGAKRLRTEEPAGLWILD